MVDLSINRIRKTNHFYTFDDLDEEAASMGDTTGKERMEL